MSEECNAWMHVTSTNDFLPYKDWYVMDVKATNKIDDIHL
jgi:hypothetical protein